MDWTEADLKQNEYINALEARCKAIEDERAAMYQRFLQHDLLTRIARLEKQAGIPPKTRLE